jgi:hypothetical protein
MIACGDPDLASRPASLSADSVISKDEMIQILVDVHLTEAALQVQRNRGQNTPDLTKDYYRWLCSKYHISKRKLNDNLNYYKQDPDKFNKMYEEVVNILTDKAKKTAVTKK